VARGRNDAHVVATASVRFHHVAASAAVPSDAGGAGNTLSWLANAAGARAISGADLDTAVPRSQMRRCTTEPDAPLHALNDAEGASRCPSHCCMPSTTLKARLAVLPTAMLQARCCVAHGCHDQRHPGEQRSLRLEGVRTPI